MKKNVITFIGGGNMTRALVGGLIKDGYEPKKIWVTDPNEYKLNALREMYGICTTLNNEDGLEHANVLVLAVKPQKMFAVAKDLKAKIGANSPLVISIAAGVTISHLEQWLGVELALVRCMPNTPVQVGCGATALFANTHVTAEQKDIAEELLRAVGITTWLKAEAQMDLIAALSGSGPAYFYLMMEALEKAAIQLGLDSELARQFTLQTGYGAATLALQSQDDPAELRQRVTSKNGTTEQAIMILEQGNFHDLFLQALKAAMDRAHEISQELGTSDLTTK